MRIAGAVLAGGRGRRMGGIEKAFLKVGDATILDRVIACLRQGCAEIVINANGDPARFVRFGVPVVADDWTGQMTPLAGLHASLGWAARRGLEWLVTVPADTPFLPVDLVPRLAAEVQTAGAVIAASRDYGHYVVGAWRTGLFAQLDHAIRNEGLFKARDWVSRCKARRIVWPAESFDPFFNINTQEDLAEANRIAADFGL